MKRHFYNGQEYQLDEVNKRVEILPTFLDKLRQKKLWGKFGFKKIGGSLIGNVLNLSRFGSPFAAFCRIFWIDHPPLDRKYLNAGQKIEPIVIDFLREKIAHPIETFDAVKYNYDYFADRHPVVGGLPDAYVKETNMIIEVKTTAEKNWDFWLMNKPPSHYIRQAQIYAHLIGADRFTIVATFLKENDYEDPAKYDIKDRKVKNWNFKVNLPQVKDDLEKAENWYRQVTVSGKSPTYNLDIDADLVAWLRCRNLDEWLDLKKNWIESGKLILPTQESNS
ncbi:MAGa7180 family putative nuclease [Mycoplasma sp. ATU-Cv-508]|uniref:MAGa7180 family putative nuclease n=1 Tax=Mycoplasma sp. ATU-Cv-508 TaxID=2048001 RepID=UPI000FDE240F